MNRKEKKKEGKRRANQAGIIACFAVPVQQDGTLKALKVLESCTALLYSACFRQNDSGVFLQSSRPAPSPFLCRWLHLEHFHEGWRQAALIWVLPSRSQRRAGRACCVYTAASSLHQVPVPVAAAVLEEVRQVEKREGAYRFSEGWIP